MTPRGYVTGMEGRGQPRIPVVVMLCARVFGHDQRTVYDGEGMDTYTAERVCNRIRGHAGSCGDGRTKRGTGNATVAS